MTSIFKIAHRATRDIHVYIRLVGLGEIHPILKKNHLENKIAVDFYSPSYEYISLLVLEQVLDLFSLSCIYIRIYTHTRTHTINSFKITFKLSCKQQIERFFSCLHSTAMY